MSECKRFLIPGREIVERGYVYILECTKTIAGRPGSIMDYYHGSTHDLLGRMVSHYTGKVRATKNRRPLKLIYFEILPSSIGMQKREMELKKLKYNQKELNELLKTFPQNDETREIYDQINKTLN